MTDAKSSTSNQGDEARLTTAGSFEPSTATGFQRLLDQFEGEHHESIVSTSSSEGLQTFVFQLPLDHDGTEAFIQGWIGSENHSHAIIVVPDIGTTIQFYRPLIAKLVSRSFNVFCFDLRGHGRSGGRLGHVHEFRDYVHDLLQVVAWIKYRSQGAAPYVLAHGFAANMAMNLALEKKKYVKGLILNAPFIATQHKLPWLKRALLYLGSDFVPWFRTPRAFLPRCLVDLEQDWERRRHDESLESEASGNSGIKGIHVQKLLTVRASHALYTSIEKAPRLMLRLRCPTLIFWPDQEEYIDSAVLENVLSRHKQRSFVKFDRIHEASHFSLFQSQDYIDTLTTKLIDWISYLQERKQLDDQGKLLR